MNKIKNTIKGFTLLELLVVVLIIGILASIALPQYKKAVLKTRLTQMQVYMDAIKKGAELYYLVNGIYPNDITSIDFDITGNAVKLEQSKITNAETVAAFFDNGTECMINNNSSACLNKHFYLLRRHLFSSSSSEKGILCGPGSGNDKDISNEICKSMSNGESVDTHGGYPMYRIGN